tara:strand:- start:275 stop:544 length:270 start_codon:yes stop_codon:yes gene_type:complete
MSKIYHFSPFTGQITYYFDQQSSDSSEYSTNAKEAKEDYKAGNIKDANIAFNRLRAYGWDVGKALASYKEERTSLYISRHFPAFCEPTE